MGTLTGSGVFHLIPRVRSYRVFFTIYCVCLFDFSSIFQAFNIPDSDTEHHYLTKALIPMIIIYLYYMRDQFLKIFFNVETVRRFSLKDTRKTTNEIFCCRLQIVSTHQHGTEGDSSFSVCHWCFSMEFFFQFSASEWIQRARCHWFNETSRSKWYCWISKNRSEPSISMDFYFDDFVFVLLRNRKSIEIILSNVEM